MSQDECESLCEDAGLNVRGSSQTVSHIIVTVGKDRRSSSTVITRLRKLAKDRDLSIGGIIFSQAPVGDDEYAFQVKS